MARELNALRTLITNLAIFLLCGLHRVKMGGEGSGMTNERRVRQGGKIHALANTTDIK